VAERGNTRQQPERVGANAGRCGWGGGDAEQSITYADRSGDAFQRLYSRTAQAEALHEAGRQAEAEARFREAEQIQAERQPNYPLLYSFQGFRYCDLLLTDAEREAGKAQGTRQKAKLLAVCRAVEQRATQTLKWMEADQRAPILTVAIDHLTLGRAALYAALLEGSVGSSQPVSESRTANARRETDAAVDGLRRAGDVHLIPRGLLTRAWLRFLTGACTGPESAQEDLDEAWEIAERGPMKLFMADIHLYRARLFGRETLYPWESPHADLAEARRLIEKCGYGRRKEELEDAEAGLRQQHS
jgi:hypothetical protein